MKKTKSIIKNIILLILFLNSVYSIYILSTENCIGHHYCVINPMRLIYLISNILIFVLTTLFFMRNKNGKNK